MGPIYLTPTALPFLASLMLAGVAAMWTLTTWHNASQRLFLTGFFGAGGAFLLALFVEFSAEADWREYIKLAEYPLAVIAFCALACATHASGPSSLTHWATLVRCLAVILATGTVCYAALLSALRSPYDLSRESGAHLQALMLLVLASFLLAFIALLRAARHQPARAGIGVEQPVPARFWRNIAVALAIPIVMGLLSLLREFELISRAALLLGMELGSLAFTAALAIIASAGPGGAWASAGSRHVGLVIALFAIWGSTCTFLGRSAEQAIIATQWAQGDATRAMLYSRGSVVSGSVSANDLPPGVLYVLRRHPDVTLIASRERDFPLLDILSEAARRERGATRRKLSALLQTNPGMDRDQALTMMSTIRPGALSFYRSYVGRAQQRYTVIRFGLGNSFYEAGFSYAAERQEIHRAITPLALGILAAGFAVTADITLVTYRQRSRGALAPRCRTDDIVRKR